MGGRREVSIIFYRPVTRSDLKQERSFFRGSVSSFLQLVVALSYLLLVCALNNPVAISMSKILGNNCY